MIDVYVALATGKATPPRSLKVEEYPHGHAIVTKDSWRRFLATLAEEVTWGPTVVEFMRAVNPLGETERGVWLQGSVELPPEQVKGAFKRYTFVHESTFATLRRGCADWVRKTSYQKGWSMVMPRATDFKRTCDPTAKEMEAYKRFLDTFNFKSSCPADKEHLQRLCDPEKKLFNLAHAKIMKNAK